MLKLTNSPQETFVVTILPALCVCTFGVALCDVHVDRCV